MSRSHPISHHSQSLRQPPAAPETIDPRWLVKALLAMLAIGLACAYASLCILFYVQQWQLVLHPSRVITQTPAAQGLTCQEVHISSGENSQLDGWWIPADTQADSTALLLHDRNGSISDAVLTARHLHEARLNVLLFDYRGFGQSTGNHPTERSMEADSDAALAWITGTKHIALSQIVVVGERGGASLAVRLGTQYSQLGGVVLFQGDGDFASRAAHDPRSKIVPFRLLFHENFPLADPLSTLKIPKLLISYTKDWYPVDVARAADPKMTFEIGRPPADAAIHEALRRFLETYLTQAPQMLTPMH